MNPYLRLILVFSLMILYIGCSDKNDIIITDDSETGEEQAMEDENDDTAERLKCSKLLC